MPTRSRDTAAKIPPGEEALEHVDVLIVGAGLSGIGAAHHLQDKCPGKSFLLLEAREDLGGTWDLFRYPGIRSDSDLHTFGYGFRPWREARAIADGASIKRYIRDTAAAGGIERRIRYRRRVARADWDGARARWTVLVECLDSGETQRLSCSFLLVCCGYYRYDEGYTPRFEGIEDFAGEVLHPQHWPERLDYSGKRVVVIGSGATAVTLVPAMAPEAAHVTMLQRSPSYVISLPGEDPLARALKRLLPGRLAFSAIRWKNVLLQLITYRASRRWPRAVRALIRKGIARQLPSGYDVDVHFKPRYDPWDQRLCVVPDGDLFKAIRSGRASIVTDRIERFSEHGIRLESGEELQADVVITATGLNLLPLGGIELAVDGREVSLPQTMVYKGMMLGGVPNLAFALGYTNASWTLKADLAGEYVCRLLRHMDAHGHDRCVPENDDPEVREQPLLDFAAGYVLRSVDRFPKSGSKAPWKLAMSYPHDVAALRFGRVDDGVMRFSSAPAPAPAAAPHEGRPESVAAAS